LHKKADGQFLNSVAEEMSQGVGDKEYGKNCHVCAAVLHKVATEHTAKAGV
jgi:hypothetical protein